MNYAELIKWIRDGCDTKKANLITELCCDYDEMTCLPDSIDKLLYLKKFYCSGNKLISLPESIGNLIKLVTIFCDHNQLISLPNSICNLTNLTIFYCSFNKLTTLPESIGNLKNLIELNCCFNKLTTLPESIGLLTNLTELDCSNSQLTTLPESISKLTNLITLACSSNNLTSLPEAIGKLTNLIKLACDYNNLTILPTSIGLCTNLAYLNCEYNNLITLPAELGNCRNLYYFYDYNNPIEFIPINVQRLLDRIENHQDIYDDNQNVHNREIQKSITKSVYSILNDSLSRQLLVKNSTIDNILKSSLADKTKSALVEYSEDEAIHTVLNISFRELLDYVWQRIENHSNKENILRILEEEMSDAECKCFTGRISRLVNCLNGFYDDIRVEIGEKEQISNIIILIRDKLISEGNYTIDAHKTLVKTALQERNYEADQIELWVNYIE